MTYSNEQAASRVEKEGKDDQWEREVIEKLAFSAITEQRRSRRWGIFFKFLLFIYLIVVLVAAFPPFGKKSLQTAEFHTAVIDVKGFIIEGGKSDASLLISGLQSAVKDKSTKGIILRINSPGGSPVQSAYVYNEIKRLKGERPDLPIYAVVTDMCASGGYYIAAATDQIFVNQSSIVGSIGVIMNGFGFVAAMEKLGIERRLLIAGQHKAILDPFSPMSGIEKSHVQKLLNGIHQQFVNAVREGRGDRLKDDPEIFSGLVWTGVEGIELGLADSIGNTYTVAKDVIGAEEIVNFTPQETFFDRFTDKLGVILGRALSEVASMQLRF